MEIKNKWFYCKFGNLDTEDGFFYSVLFAHYINHDKGMFPRGIPIDDLKKTSNINSETFYIKEMLDTIDNNLKKIENILSEITPDTLDSTTLCHIHINDKNQAKFIITNNLDSKNKLEISFVFTSFEEAEKYRDTVEEYIKEAFRAYFKNKA